MAGVSFLLVGSFLQWASKPHSCQGGRFGVCRATGVWGRKSAGQQLQKLYCLLVSANTYVIPVTKNHLQGMHVLVKDTAALLWGGQKVPLSLPRLSVAGPCTHGRAG